MLGQEREHAARLQQMPRDRLDIQQIPLILRPTLHPEIISTRKDQQAETRGLFSAVLARGRRGTPGGATQVYRGRHVHTGPPDQRHACHPS